MSEHSEPSEPTMELTIQGMTFTAPKPFATGHVCNEAEASVLNSVLSENLRNNFARRVATMLSEGKDHEAIQAAFDEYARSYSFSVFTSSNKPKDPVTREATRIATLAVQEALRAKGLKLDEYPKDRFTGEVERLSRTEAVVAEAKRRVEAARNLAEVTLQL